MAAKQESERNSPPEDTRNASAFPEQDENGIDLSLLRENLRLTPVERLRQHQRALRNVRALQHARERTRPS